MKLEKGQPGYIKARKLRYLMLAVAEFAIVAAVFILGYMQTGSRMNLFTVAAAVGCLPAAKMLVEFITMAPHKVLIRKNTRSWKRRPVFLPGPMT